MATEDRGTSLGLVGPNNLLTRLGDLLREFFGRKPVDVKSDVGLVNIEHRGYYPDSHGGTFGGGADLGGTDIGDLDDPPSVFALSGGVKPSH
ncbi:MAG: hypothetical protein ACRDY0_07745 [Acidimicrobiales bacterium]